MVKRDEYGETHREETMTYSKAILSCKAPPQGVFKSIDCLLSLALHRGSLKSPHYPQKKGTPTCELKAKGRLRRVLNIRSPDPADFWNCSVYQSYPCIIARGCV